MHPKTTYISISAGSTKGAFEDAWHTTEQALPDWYIVDEFFQNNNNIPWVEDVHAQGRVYWLKAGELSKRLTEVENILTWLTQNNANRQQSVAVIGGGTVLDAGLFAASIYQRGMQKWSLPTTLLAAVDAGIGGKNGVNFMGFKNYIGTITQPDFVVSDFRVFDSLEAVDVLNGWMEMAKHALIADPALWDSMKQFETIPPTKTVHILIREAAAIKKRLVEADEYESGLRKTLNFGHTVGHALESAAASRSENLPHGIAVGLGMMVSLHWSADQAADPGIQRELVDAAHCIKRWLTRAAPAYVQIAVNAADLDALWAFMEMDKKNDTNGVQEVRLTNIGQAEWNQLLSRSAFGTSWSSAHGGV